MIKLFLNQKSSLEALKFNHFNMLFVKENINMLNYNCLN